MKRYSTGTSTIAALLKIVFPCLLLFFAFACNRQKQVPEREPDLPYNMVAIQPDVSVLRNAVAGKPIFAKLSSELDFTQVQAMQSSTEDVALYIIKVRGKDQYYGVKLNSSLATTELLYSRKMADPQNGTIGLIKGGEGIIISYHDGIRTIREMTEPDYNVHFTRRLHGGVGFCQREAGESFGACYNAESDEFCDSFPSCIALATNPHVAILIGIACSCRAF